MIWSKIESTIVVILLVACAIKLQIQGVESLKCYKCLNLDCPDAGRGQKNELLCQSVRSFIIKSMLPFYEIGSTGYIGPCPDIKETLQWSLMQHNPTSCPEIREQATCSLGRLQVTTGPNSGNVVISHATILGCVKPALLYHMKGSSSSNFMGCSTFLQNNTNDENSHYVHRLLLENCPKVTEYCKTKNFCVSFDQSIVKPFQNVANDRSFENGLIIGIIAFIMVLVTVGFLAGTCQNPLSRSSNYSPARVQITTVEEIPEVDCPLKDDC